MIVLLFSVNIRTGELVFYSTENILCYNLFSRSIIADAEVTKTLVTHRLQRGVASLRLFIRLYHNKCSEEYFECIPLFLFHYRTSWVGIVAAH